MGIASASIEYHKPIFDNKKIILKPMDGIKPLGTRSDVFDIYKDPDFERWNLNVAGKPTGETQVRMVEQIHDANFIEMFGAFGKKLDKLCLEQDQIEQFCGRYTYLLQPRGRATFFLFKVRKEYFVAHATRRLGMLERRPHRFLSDDGWEGLSRNRIVVPF